MSPLRDLFETCIEHTAPKALISLRRLYLGRVPRPVGKIISQLTNSNNRHIYISTKALKHIYDRHIYDKKIPEDFSLLLNNFIEIIKHPDCIYRNPLGKRGDFLFAKEIGRRTFIIIVEIAREKNCIEIVSAFNTGKKYLKEYSLLWSGRTANPPS